VQRAALGETQEQLDRAFPTIRLSGSKTNADGEYESMSVCDDFENLRTGAWDGQELRFRILRSGRHWEIVGETLPTVDEDGDEDWDSVETKTLWRAPHIACEAMPPCSGWEAVDRFARNAGGKPKIEYVRSDQY